MIGSAYEEGGKILLDGRNPKVDGYPDGNWVGPTVIDDVKVGMSCYKNEIFGPVLCIMYADTLEDAIKLINNN